MVSRSKELAKNTLILFFGVFCTKIVQFLLLPLYTSILTTSEYGAVELFNTIITLLLPIIGLQVEHGVFRFLIDRRGNEKEEKRIISSSLFFILISNAICILLFLSLNHFIQYEYKWILIISLCINNIYNYLLQVARGMGDNKRYSIANIFTTLFTVIANIMFLLLAHLNATGLLYGAILGYAAGTLFLFVKLQIAHKISHKYISPSYLKKILKYSLPMVPNTLSWWVFSSSDRIIVSWLIGLSATGILSIAYKFSNITAIIYGVFNLSLTESVSVHIHERDFSAFYNKVLSIVSQIFISFGSMLIAFMPIIFTMLIESDYNSAYNLIPLATIASILQILAEFLGTIYIAKRNTRSVAITSILAAIINIVVDIVLIPVIGIYAAVVSTVISYLFLFVYRLINVNYKYIKVHLTTKNILYFFLGIIVLSGLYYIDYPTIKLLCMLIASYLIVIFNRKDISSIMSFIKGKYIRKTHFK